MLSNEVIRKINRQIEAELRTVDSMFSDNDEKMAALDRIAKLKAILSPETVTVITAEPTDADEYSFSDLMRDLAQRLKKH